jgi:hypothetical protein
LGGKQEQHSERTERHRHGHDDREGDAVAGGCRHGLSLSGALGRALILDIYADTGSA